MKTTLLAFLLIISLVTLGQKKEYLIKHNGDTLFGAIHLKDKAFFVTGLNNDAVILNA